MNQRTANPRMDVSVTPKLVIDVVSTRSLPSDRSPSESPRTDERAAKSSAPEVEAVESTNAGVAAETVEPDPVEQPTPASPPAEPRAEVPQTAPSSAATTAGPEPDQLPPAVPADGEQSLSTPAGPCTVGVVTEPSLRAPTTTALAAIDAVTPHISFAVADTGPISISHGGEWPAVTPPLGWTAPDRRTILINPDHPASLIDAALADVIAHELGHVLISTAHVDDGTILDPHIDGRITIGPEDRSYLGNLTCGDLGW